MISPSKRKVMSIKFDDEVITLNHGRHTTKIDRIELGPFRYTTHMKIHDRVFYAQATMLSSTSTVYLIYRLHYMLSVKIQVKRVWISSWRQFNSFAYIF